MAPLLNHPPGLNFVGDPQHEERPIDSDPSVYYGGTEYHSRSRTYSTVRVHLWLVLRCLHPALVDE
jgi:alpha,alpha-trehalase